MAETIACPACHRALTGGVGADGNTTRCNGCGAVLAAAPTAVVQEVQRAATALSRTGWLGMVCGVGLIVFLLLQIAWLPSSGLLPKRPMAGEDPERRPVPQKDAERQPPRPLPSGIRMADRLYGACWFAVVGPCWAILVLGSARQMRRLAHYESARMGCLLALVPLNLAWFVGVPVGIRGLRLLARPEVRAVFTSSRSQVQRP